LAAVFGAIHGRQILTYQASSPTQFINFATTVDVHLCEDSVDMIDAWVDSHCNVGTSK
jgi:hypothetical protein